MRSRSTPRLKSLALLIAACLAAGCSSDNPDESNPVESLSGVTLHLLVVDDSALAAAIGQIRSEWEDQTDATLQVTETSAAELLAGKTIDADAVIYPSALLGPLAEAKKIARIERDWLDDERLDWSDVFALVRQRECRWGDDSAGHIYAVPLGSPVLVCAYRSDLLKALDMKRPQTWSEYATLAEAFGDRSRLGKLAPPDDAPWSGALEPLAPGWASFVLLARAAPYVRHRDQYSTLFDLKKMEPLIGRACYVRALDELVAVALGSDSRSLQTTPQDARRALLRGECGMTLTWLSAADDQTEKQSGGATEFPIDFCELPGSAEAFRFGRNKWAARGNGEDPRAPLLGISGRLGSIVATSEHPHGALRMLAWLSGRNAGGRPSSASGATTLFRRSQIRNADNWVPRDVPSSTARRYGAVVQQTLSHSRCLFAPRMAGRAEYLASLDTAVRDAVQGRQAPADALKQAATEWQAITDKLGPQPQQAAYHRSLGLEP